MDNIQKVSGYHPYQQVRQKLSACRPCPGRYTENFCPIIVRLLDFTASTSVDELCLYIHFC
jgi:hypothetical protein